MGKPRTSKETQSVAAKSRKPAQKRPKASRKRRKSEQAKQRGIAAATESSPVTAGRTKRLDSPKHRPLADTVGATSPRPVPSRKQAPTAGKSRHGARGESPASTPPAKGRNKTPGPASDGKRARKQGPKKRKPSALPATSDLPQQKRASRTVAARGPRPPIMQTGSSSALHPSGAPPRSTTRKASGPPNITKGRKQWLPSTSKQSSPTGSRPSKSQSSKSAISISAALRPGGLLPTGKAQASKPKQPRPSSQSTKRSPPKTIGATGQPETSAVTAAARKAEAQPLSAFEAQLREHHERIIQQAVTAERHRRELTAALAQHAAPTEAPTRGRKTPPNVVWSLVRLAAGGAIPKAASQLGVSAATLRRWLRDGAPATQQWRLNDLREQTRLGQQTLKEHSNAIVTHLQQALVHGLLPERTADAEYRTNTQRRVGRRQVKTWRWPIINEATAKRMLAWFRSALRDSRKPLWQIVVGYAQFGTLPSEERDGYRGGKNVAYQPGYTGPELVYEDEVAVDSYWNSPVVESRAAALRELERYLTEVVGALSQGTVQRLDVLEIRNFDWRKAKQ